MTVRALLLAAALLPILAHASPARARSAETSARTETEYTVREGETLNGIANRAGVASKAIAEANGLKPPFPVRTGQKLKIPRKTAPAASKAQASSPERESIHVVTEGETLGGIANRAKVPRILIAEANGLTPPYAVLTGQKLHIPRTRRYTVRNGDTGLDIAAQYDVPWNQIAVANGIDPAAALVPGKELLIPTLLNAAAADETGQNRAANDSKPARPTPP
ncbi:LysM peptidoglycan-binding domain-containing protein [Novosphingobium sp. RD2P27]|uniref:LysM peptidoglycan-binding domain-containing protein n=1 Tax=Novosphingobium kalidii TaxID=3230299 RepID=A0ABV2D101_9SPHN